MLALVVRTYERDRLVLEHRFFGETKAEALAYFRAHQKYDAFFAACTHSDHFGCLPCRSEIFWWADR